MLDSYYERHAKHLPSQVQADIAIKSLKAFFGSGSVALVTPRNNERYIDRCRKEGLSNATINQRFNRLRAALRMAMKDGDLKAAPMVPMLEENDPRADYLERKQVAALLRAARKRPHVAMFVRLAVYTGARASAILQLTWDRVDLKTGAVDFRLPGNRHSRKRRAVTAVPTRLLASLRRYRKRAATDHVIEYEGSPIKSIKRAFRETAKEAKLSWVTPHILKHTAATLALRVASPWIVSGMMATSVRTLQKIYGKHMLGDLRAAAEAVAHSGIVRKERANPAKKRATRKRRNVKKSRRK
ncbi:tyrosine-type recombinase/integrase [Sagittula sp.]|uniref:tyrosine-type recombinase/integrase n=1 Tax=Sagittula sp. TaxID=2038081 RepID=UPI0035183754